MPYLSFSGRCDKPLLSSLWHLCYRQKRVIWICMARTFASVVCIECNLLAPLPSGTHIRHSLSEVSASGFTCPLPLSRLSTVNLLSFARRWVADTSPMALSKYAPDWVSFLTPPIPGGYYWSKLEQCVYRMSSAISAKPTTVDAPCILIFLDSWPR